MRIVVEGDTVEKLVHDLDGKEKYVGWVEQEPSGKYIITNKGNSEAQMYT
jgi:Mn-dependent DtxR family transcriptional regulator